MKLNWGHGLSIAIALGVAGILTMVYLSSREKIDLVTEDYYPKELAYEKQIEKQLNTQNLKQKVIVSVTDTISFKFPEICNEPSQIHGEILFYRPSDKAFDRKEIVKLNKEYIQKFITSEFPAGKYDIILEWSCNATEYLQKEALFIEN